MAGFDLHAYAWPRIRELADALPRPAVVQDVRSRFVPELGALDESRAARLIDAYAAALEDVVVLPTHGTPHRWAAPMLRDGFRWTRPTYDGFEPYTDKLAELGALGAGETAEDFLFVGLRMLPRAASLDDALAGVTTRGSGWVRASVSELRTLAGSYGDATLVFEPEVLARATTFPNASGAAHYGARAGSIEHLPHMLAARAAEEWGFLDDRIAEAVRLDGDAAAAARLLEGSAARQAKLNGAIDRSAPAELTALAGHDLLSRRLARLPIESHVRGLVPQEVALVDVRPPTTHRTDFPQLGVGAYDLLPAHDLAGLQDATRGAGAVLRARGHAEAHELLERAMREYPDARHDATYLTDREGTTGAVTARLRQSREARRAAAEAEGWYRPPTAR